MAAAAETNAVFSKVLGDTKTGLYQWHSSVVCTLAQSSFTAGICTFHTKAHGFIPQWALNYGRRKKQNGI